MPEVPGEKRHRARSDSERVGTWTFLLPTLLVQARLRQNPQVGPPDSPEMQESATSGAASPLANCQPNSHSERMPGTHNATQTQPPFGQKHQSSGPGVCHALTAHRQVDEQPTARSKKNDESAVATLKKNDWHENVREPVVNHAKGHDRSGRPERTSS